MTKENNMKTADEKLVRRFKRVRIALMRSPQFMACGPVMMLGTNTISDSVPTACTDGRNEIYGKAFIESLDDRELAFVIMHETFHKMCRHMTTYQQLWKLDARRTNMATDYWINQKLLDADPKQEVIAMPMKDGKQVGLRDDKYKGMTVKRIWDMLKDEQKEGGGEGGEGGGGGGLDEHDWEGADGMSKEEVEKLAQEINQAIRQGQMAAKQAGHGKGNQALGLDELLQPKVDWREQLQEFVRETCRSNEISTWRRPNRRYLHVDIIMPTMQGESLKELVMAVDASGSMMGKPMQMVMTEVKGLAEQLSISKVHIIYWDGDVEAHETYDAQSFKDWQSNTKPMGGGGTTPACITTYLRKQYIKPDAVVVLTDGEVSGWGEWDGPVLWAIYNPRNKITAPVGKTIHIED
jgi:predicted metal-dependent peptidase